MGPAPRTMHLYQKQYKLQIAYMSKDLKAILRGPPGSKKQYRALLKSNGPQQTPCLAKG